MPTVSIRFPILFAAALATCSFLQGCVFVDTHHKCGGQCSGDKQVTDQIRTILFQRPDIMSNDIEVQTLDGVVYLHGLIDTDVQRQTILDAVNSVPGVVRVIDSLALRGSFR